MYKIDVKGVITTNDTGEVYHYFGWDCCCPRDISRELEKAGGEDVVLEINSGGGVCTSGFEMYNALKQYSGKVTVHVINAMSAATFLACAADETLISKMGIMMVHNTKSWAEGDYREMDKGSEMLRAFNESAIVAYEEKTGRSREELQEMMDRETYMSPERAIEYGFADGYIQSEKEQEASSGELIVVNAECPVMSDEKAHEILQFLHGKEDVCGQREMPSENKEQSNGGNGSTEAAVSDKNSGKEKNSMTLEEIYAEHPELKAEVDTLVDAAGTSGAQKERQRLESLDAIAGSVSPEILQEAKYGEDAKRMDARELAYQAMVEDSRKAGNYMKDAMKDSEDSHVEQVAASPDEAKEAADESDAMSSFVNAGRKRKGGMKDAVK